MSIFQVSSEIWAVDRARVSAGLQGAWFGSRALMGHQIDDLRVYILKKSW